MSFLMRLFAPPALRSQQEVAERVARVIDHVIFDLGVDRLMQGTVGLDARLRPHFFSARPGQTRGLLACVPLSRLAQSAAVDARAPVAGLVNGLLREFSAQSPRFRALPASRPAPRGASQPLPH